MLNLIAKMLSKRVRELERHNTDLKSLIDKDFDKVSVTRMNFDAQKGGFMEAEFKAGVGGIIAAWAYNALEACNAKNYLEISMFHPKGGFITITIQKHSGETPGQKITRLEAELARVTNKVEEGHDNVDVAASP